MVVVANENILNEQDNNLVWSVCYKYFRAYANMADDLVQVALFHLWKVKNKYDPTKGTYATFVYFVSYRAMARAIKKEREQTDNLLSLDYDYSTDGNESITLADIVSANNFDKYNLDEDYLLGVLEHVKNANFNRRCRDDDRFKRIVDLLCSGNSSAEIAKQMGFSTQYINFIVQRFRAKLKKVLTAEGYTA